MSFLLGILLCGIWISTQYGIELIAHLTPDRAFLAFGLGLVLVTASFFALFARKMSYAQAKRDHLLITTPFLRLKTSYRRIHQVTTAEFHSLQPPEELRWAQRKYLNPLIHKTVVVVQLVDYPLPLSTLRFFLPKEMLEPDTAGYVVVVDDWLSLSTELDSFMGSWRRHQSGAPGWGRGGLLP